MARDLGILTPDNVLWTKKIKSSMGIDKRKVINLTFYLAGRKIKTVATVANRSSLKTPVIVGRRDLAGFLVKPYQ